MRIWQRKFNIHTTDIVNRGCKKWNPFSHFQIRINESQEPAEIQKKQLRTFAIWYSLTHTIFGTALEHNTVA